MGKKPMSKIQTEQNMLKLNETSTNCKKNMMEKLNTKPWRWAVGRRLQQNPN